MAPILKIDTIGLNSYFLFDASTDRILKIFILREGLQWFCEQFRLTTQLKQEKSTFLQMHLIKSTVLICKLLQKKVSFISKK